MTASSTTASLSGSSFCCGVFGDYAAAANVAAVVAAVAVDVATVAAAANVADAVAVVGWEWRGCSTGR